MKKATSKDWKIKPLPKKRSLIPADRQFTSAEMDRISRGFIPMAMEEKWFIFFKSNQLYFHRSWTGYCVFVAHFKRRQDGYVLHLIEANRNAKQYSEKDDSADARLVSEIIDNFLLAPQTSKGPAGLIAALDQASKPNYLGDPDVVGNILRKYRDMVVETCGPKTDPDDKRACYHGFALGMADIFLGRASAYAPMIPWNSPGQIDKWIASVFHRPGFDSDTPEETIANALICYINDHFHVVRTCVENHKSEDWTNAEMGKVDSRYIHLMLGIPHPQDEQKHEDDELCEDDELELP
jgi:hypothetical protein